MVYMQTSIIYDNLQTSIIYSNITVYHPDTKDLLTIIKNLPGFTYPDELKIKIPNINAFTYDVKEYDKSFTEAIDNLTTRLNSDKLINHINHIANCIEDTAVKDIRKHNIMVNSMETLNNQIILPLNNIIRQLNQTIQNSNHKIVELPEKYLRRNSYARIPSYEKEKKCIIF